MIDFGYYLLKVSVCSGILYCYYYLGLRNKKFHAWNRFYLLATVVISLLLPLIKIQVSQPSETNRGAVVQLLNVALSGDHFMQEVKTQPIYQFPFERAATIGYTLVCALMLTVMIRTLIYINNLIRRNPVQLFKDFSFVNTNAKGTPFSFFKYVFWNKQIEPGSETGQQMLSHELVHVKEKHTHDKIFINLILPIFWSNPFFWLIRREMAMIHEFIADQKSVSQGNTEAFASMILHTVFPQHRLGITNYFFHSPLKRRLCMLTKISNRRSSYISRLLVLPLISILIAAFSFKVKDHEPDLGFMNDVRNQEKIERNILSEAQSFALSNAEIFENPDRSARLYSEPIGAVDTIKEIIEYDGNSKKDLENRKKAAALLNISEKEIQRIHFERIEHEGITIKVATVVTLKDKTTKEISKEDSKKIGIIIPGSRTNTTIFRIKSAAAKVKYRVVVNQIQPVQKLLTLRNIESNLNQGNQPLSQLTNPNNLESQTNPLNKPTRQIQPNKKNTVVVQNLSTQLSQAEVDE